MAISTANMDRSKWLEIRRSGIGGSDAAACVGLSSWKQPIDVYLDKLGELPDREQEIGDAMYWGNKLEPVVADWFSESTGKKVVKRNAILTHKKYPFLFANVDRLLKGEKAGLEIKTTNAFSGRSKWGDDQVPEEYYVQCLHYMMVTGLPKWYLAVLIGGNDPKVYSFERDEEAIQNLMEAEVYFWNEYVQKRVPPPITDYNESTIKALYPVGNGSQVILGVDAVDLAGEYVRLTKVESEAKKQKEMVKAQLMAMMGQSEIGRAGNFEVSWKTSAPKQKFDTDKFAAENDALYKQYLKDVAASRTFGVKELKKGVA